VTPNVFPEVVNLVEIRIHSVRQNCTRRIKVKCARRLIKAGSKRLDLLLERSDLPSEIFSCCHCGFDAAKVSLAFMSFPERHVDRADFLLDERRNGLAGRTQLA